MEFWYMLMTRSTAEGIREAMGWECPVDKNSVYALCQLHEVYVDEDEASGPSKTSESWNPGGNGKEKTILAFKLASDIIQQTDFKKVFEERILDSRVEFSLRELPVSHRNACELSPMEAMIRMADNGMGSNMYRCVRFPCSAKNMVL